MRGLREPFVTVGGLSKVGRLSYGRETLQDLDPADNPDKEVLFVCSMEAGSCRTVPL